MSTECEVCGNPVTESTLSGYDYQGEEVALCRAHWMQGKNNSAWIRQIDAAIAARRTPVRVVRSRVKGSKLTSPNGLPVVCVTRGTKWGNPRPLSAGAGEMERLAAVGFFSLALKAGRLPFTVDDVKRELRGKNLACWCKESPCHADVLLEIANAE